MKNSIIKKYYKLWLTVVGILFALTIAGIIFFSVVAARIKEEEKIEKENRISVSEFNTEDQLLANYLNSRITPIDVNYTDKFFSIELLGYISDAHSITLYYDLIFDKDYAYELNRGENEHWDTGVNITQDGKALFSYGHCLGQDDNVFHFFLAACSNDSLEGKEISFTVNNVRLVRNSGVNTVMQTYFTYLFQNDDIYGGSHLFPVRKYVDVGYYGQGYLNHMMVSPYGIAFEWDSHSDKGRKEDFSSNCIVRDKSGNVIKLLYKSQNYIYFEKPIQTSQLAGIEMGKFEYDFTEEENDEEEL